MATTSEVDAGHDNISAIIAGATQARAQAKQRLLAARNQLASITTDYSDVIATVNAYTPTGAFETLAKDKQSKLAAEFVALKTALEAELDDLGVPYS